VGIRLIYHFFGAGSNCSSRHTHPLSSPMSGSLLIRSSQPRDCAMLAIASFIIHDLGLQARHSFWVTCPKCRLFGHVAQVLLSVSALEIWHKPRLRKDEPR